MLRGPMIRGVLRWSVLYSGGSGRASWELLDPRTPKNPKNPKNQPPNFKLQNSPESKISTKISFKILFISSKYLPKKIQNFLEFI
jgi:hypothetical protein